MLPRTGVLFHALPERRFSTLAVNQIYNIDTLRGDLEIVKLQDILPTIIYYVDTLQTE